MAASVTVLLAAIGPTLVQSWIIRNVISEVGNDIKIGVDKLFGLQNDNQSDSLFGHITGDNRAHLFTDVKTADIYLNVPQLLTKYGYPSETYDVQTEDGYLIALHRIPHGKDKPGQPSKNVVILYRALFCSTYQYLFLGPERAIAYRLADMGYDVWMVEMRGNSYSRGHVKLQPTEETFWDMSWSEMGKYDVPASINFVLKKTGVDKVFVAGHSMGATVLFVATSVHPDLNDKIRLLIAMGPATFTKHMGGPLGLVGKVLPKSVINLIPYQSLMPLTVLDLMVPLGKFACGLQASALFCTAVVSIVDGNDFGNLNTTALPAMIAHIPESDSNKNAFHYLQGVNSGKFQDYDYGMIGNVKKYGKKSPPEFDLKQVTAPVAIFASNGDKFAGPEDVQMLASKLPNVVGVFMTKDKGFTHIDFTFGNNSPEQVNLNIYNIMEKY